jgi:hypothetical protein
MALLDTSSGGARIIGSGPLGISDYPFTMACWALITSTAANDRFAMAIGNTEGNDNRHSMFHTSIRRVQVNSRVGGNNAMTACAAAQTPALEVDTWYPLIVRFSSTTLREIFYSTSTNCSNADERNFTSATNSINSAQGVFQLGARPDGLGNRWPGLIAHPAVWNKALTTEEMQQFFDGENPLTIANANLHGYWAEDFFEDGGIWYYEDKSGNDYHLTLEANAVRDTDTTGPEVDAPPAGDAFVFTTAPTVTARSSTNYTIAGTLSAQGQVHAVAIPHGDPTPSIAQIVAGQNAAGAAAPGSGNASTTSSAPHNFSVTVSGSGITANPSHDLHYVGRKPE